MICASSLVAESWIVAPKTRVQFSVRVFILLSYPFSLQGLQEPLVLKAREELRTKKSRYERNGNEQGPWISLFRSVSNAGRLCVGPFRFVSVFGTARGIPHSRCAVRNEAAKSSILSRCSSQPKNPLDAPLSNSPICLAAYARGNTETPRI